MRRWWRARRRPGSSHVSLERKTPKPSRGQRDAARALRRAECARDEARNRRAEVTETAARLREARRENHFAERFRMTLEGGA